MHFNFFFNIDGSVIVDILGIIINAVLGFWIVTVFQKKQGDSRVLKNHIIEEIKEIRIDYNKLFNDLYLGKVGADTVPARLKLLNIRIRDIIDIAKNESSINELLFRPYQVELRDIVTSFDEFITAFHDRAKIKLEDASKSKLIEFKQKNNHLFNDFIIAVNHSNIN